VQPVASEARLSLIRGVLPIAATTSFRIVICLVPPGVSSSDLATP
jgi:hypothetical protein